MDTWTIWNETNIFKHFPTKKFNQLIQVKNNELKASTGTEYITFLKRNHDFKMWNRIMIWLFDDVKKKSHEHIFNQTVIYKLINNFESRLKRIKNNNYRFIFNSFRRDY